MRDNTCLQLLAVSWCGITAAAAPLLRELVAGREMSEEEAAGRAEKGRVAAAVTAAEVAAQGEAGLLSEEREAGA